MQQVKYIHRFLENKILIKAVINAAQFSKNNKKSQNIQ